MDNDELSTSAKDRAAEVRLLEGKLAELRSKGVTTENSASPQKVDSEPDKVVLFSIDDKDYYVPAKIGPNVALAYMRDIRQQGLEYARAGMLERMLGSDGLRALAEYEELTEEDLNAVMEAVDKHVLGPLQESGKGSGFVIKK